MPYRSNAQRRYFHANRAELERQGVNVDEWDRSSEGMGLPERAKKKKKGSEGMEMLKNALSVKVPKKYKGYKVKVDNKMKNFGETDDEKKVVRINKKKSLKKGGVIELKDTIFHERYHVDHPGALERTTRKKTKQYVNKIKKHV